MCLSTLDLTSVCMDYTIFQTQQHCNRVCGLMDSDYALYGRCSTYTHEVSG